MSLLDTVRPDGHHYDCEEDLYMRSTVESLLSQCRKEARKEAFLEAAEYCDELAKLYPREDIGFDKGYSLCGARAASELRRMAESDKTTMEGESDIHMAAARDADFDSEAERIFTEELTGSVGRINPDATCIDDIFIFDDALPQQVKSDARDAERYRYLRSHNAEQFDRLVEDSLDDAIDAAISAQD